MDLDQHPTRSAGRTGERAQRSAGQRAHDQEHRSRLRRALQQLQLVENEVLSQHGHGDGAAMDAKSRATRRSAARP